MIADKRYAHFDIVAKVAVLEIEDINTGLRYEDVRNVFVSNTSFSPQSAAAERIKKALEFLSESFPVSYKYFRHRTIVQSIITFVCHMQKVGLEPDHHDKLRGFIEWYLKESKAQVELGQMATDQDFWSFTVR